MKIKTNQYKKIAFALSLGMLILWGILGTGTSLAWFTDTSSEIKNIFHVAEFDLEVFYKQTINEPYKPIKSDTKVFDDEALYEPGYVQVVYLKVRNNGTVPFDYKTAVNVTNYTVATNVFGKSFNLQDYLRFGLVMGDTEAEVTSQIADRTKAVKNATMPLNNYATDTAVLAPKQEVFMALIVRMPEEVGNEANYRGETIPRVELGLIVTATQQGMPKQ